MNKIILYISMAVVAVLTMGASSCDNDAQVASRNLSQDADNFRIPRRIVFYNGITDNYMLEIRGLCSLEAATSVQRSVAVTCKGPDGYKKHILALSDNVTFFMEQLAGKDVSVDFYKVTFKPTAIIPDFRLEMGNK